MKDDNKKSRDEQQEETFPGYPHYPAKEDIMNPSNDMERVQVDVENLTPSGKYADVKDNPADAASSGADTAGEDDLNIAGGTEADVTRDDLLALGGSSFSEDDLRSGTRPAMRSGEELDVPGAELDNANEAIGEEDEENNYYSLGGDRQEHLEEDPSV